LRREGFDTEIATDGSKALGIIKKTTANGLNPIDLVITDVIMPNMNGIELLRWIKKNRPLIPVILLTGFGDEDAAAQTVRPGCDQYGKKPITPGKLLKLIECIDSREGFYTQRPDNIKK